MQTIGQVASLLLALAMFALVVGAALYPFVMLVDVLMQPRSRWRQVGRSKVGWALIVLFGSFIGALAYALTVRRDLKAAAGDPNPAYAPPPPPPPVQGGSMG